MGKKDFLLYAVSALLLATPFSAFAQSVGDACTGTDRQYTVSGTSTSVLICNGSTLELLEKDLANPARKGIRTATPAATLHVNGEAIIGNTSLACSGTTEGALRWDATKKCMEVCNATAWECMVASSTTGDPSTPPSGTGYFVLTSGSWDGNLGSTTGADAKCLTDLTANDWLNKSDASSRGLLDSTHVKAWISGSSVNNALANVTYTFAVSGDNTKGGATFVTDSNGRGPGNTQNWSGTNYFDGYKEYWTGRDMGDTATLWGTGSFDSDSFCFNGASGWSTNASSPNKGKQGISSATDKNRFNHSKVACNLTRRLVCFVHP